MTGFPPLKDELQPRDKLKKRNTAALSDEAVEDNSRKLAQKWGASSTSTAPEPTPVSPAPVVSMRCYVPEYLDYDLSVKAAQQRVTKTFLIMDALAKAGYRIEDVDMNQDRRRNRA